MMKATLLVLAGGLGSRYQGQKQVDTVSLQDESLMEFALFDALYAGFSKFVFVVNDQFPESFKKRLDRVLTQQNAEVEFVEQTLNKFIPKQYDNKLKGRKKPLGTAHAVYCAQNLIKEPFVTVNADDFYGRHSFETAMQAIRQGKINARNFGMVAFNLKNTLSENGSVSRGICAVKDDKLLKVEEFTRIAENKGKLEGYNENLHLQELAEDAPVSMNFWVLDPVFFDFAQQDLQLFLEAHDDLSAVEFYLPGVVDKAIQQHKIDVAMLPTDKKWFGLTYPGDKENAVQEIEAQKSRGIYPQELWVQKVS